MQKRKYLIGMLVALTSPWVLVLAGVRGLAIVVYALLIVLSIRIVLDIIWPDKTEDEPS